MSSLAATMLEEMHPKLEQNSPWIVLKGDALAP